MKAVPKARTRVGYSSGAKIQMVVLSSSTKNWNTAPATRITAMLFATKPMASAARQAHTAPAVSTRLRGK